MKNNFLVFAGPCVIESKSHTVKIANALKEMAEKYQINLVFKASFDKANRSSIHSYRGPGLIRGLEILREVQKRCGLKIISDIHEVNQVEKASDVLDFLQIPAFLCRQTDLLVACGKSGKPVNVKKGQFMSPWDMKYVVEKIRSTGNKEIFLTERGSSFGYNNLVVDFRSLIIMKMFGQVIFDCTHSVQLPGKGEGCTTGEKEYIFPLMRGALAVGVDGLFIEVHDNPSSALCDGTNMLDLSEMETIFQYINKTRR
jgi:2-dehydro-3-deoxyphosphooctonate aldolase (KDO 8-P synthase)